MKPRKLTRRSLQAGLLALAVNLIAPAPALAQSAHRFPNITVKNFGQLDERFYRGALPKEGDFKDLAALGIKTVIDLQDEPASYEKRAAEAAGMRYVHIPMSDSKPPREEQIEQFLKLANDPATGSFFVHCLGGRHRTGVAGAVYRMSKYGWDFDQAYKEMKDFDFYTRWGHGALKDYVKVYAGNLKSIEVSAGHSSINK